MKYPIRFFALILLASSFTGCLTDTITGPQVVARLVYPPPSARFQAINYQPNSQPPLGDMVVRWQRSPSDTQLNFKGYYIQLWTSKNTYDSSLKQLTDSLVELKNTAHVYRVGNHIDTFVKFPGIPYGDYTVLIWGQKSTDTLGYSRDSLVYAGKFDPRPLNNPTNLQAVAFDPQTVILHWNEDPITDTNSGMLGYTVFRRDPNKSHDTAVVVASAPPHSTQAQVSAPAAANSQGGTGAALERAYQYYVKSVRNDSTYFDTTSGASIVWSGAERVPQRPTNTSANAGYSIIRHTIFFGQQNQQWDVVEDSASTTNDAQIQISISGNNVTLTPLGTTLISSHVDPDSGLDSHFYSAPVDQSTYQSVPVTLIPVPTSDTLGRILYVQITDPKLTNKPEWARLFVKHQKDGSFINSALGGIDIQGRFQPGVAVDGGSHLPYY